MSKSITYDPARIPAEKIEEMRRSNFDQGPMVATRYATQAEHDKDGAVRVFYQAVVAL